MHLCPKAQNGIAHLRSSCEEIEMKGILYLNFTPYHPRKQFWDEMALLPCLNN